MKKFLSIFLILAVVFIAPKISNAQQATLMPLLAGDSISTSSSLDTVNKTISVTAGYSALGIQVVTTKISGTVAGKAYLYVSLDGTNYTLTDSSAAFANQTTNVAVFTKVTTPYTSYRIQVRAADGAVSTQVNRVRVYYVLRRHD